MNYIDLCNTFFESGGAYYAWKNVYELYKDKEVKGIDWKATVFYVFWGISNIYIYRNLHLSWSVVAGAFLLLANAVWVGMVIKYKYFTSRGLWI